MSVDDPVIITCAISRALADRDQCPATPNGDPFAKARPMTLDVGRRPATVAEARALLGIPAQPAEPLPA